MSLSRLGPGQRGLLHQQFTHSVDGTTGFRTAAEEERPAAVSMVEPIRVLRRACDGLFTEKQK